MSFRLGTLVAAICLTLAYLLLELTASHPRYPQWVLSYRIHHRSGLFGAFGEIHGASNGIGIGLKYRF